MLFRIEKLEWKRYKEILHGRFAIAPLVQNDTE